MKKKHGIMKRPGGSGGGGGLLDRLLVPRIEQYAVNNNYTEIDEVVEHLRKTYKEYQRRQLGPFRTMVTRAVGILQHKGEQTGTELQLQSLEQKHLTGRRAAGKGDGPSSSSGSSQDEDGGHGGSSDDEGGSSSGADDGSKKSNASSSGSESGSDDSDSSDPELDPREAAALANTAACPPGHLNNTLLNMYAQSTTPTGTGPADGAAGVTTDGAGPVAAFAPPALVAAAAARALAKEKAEREAKKAGSSAAAASKSAAGDNDGPSTSRRAAAAAAIVTPAPAVRASAAAPPASAPPAVAAGAAAGGPKRQREEVGGKGGAAGDGAGDTGGQGIPKSVAKRARRLTQGAGGGGGGGGASRMAGGGGAAGGSAVTAAKPVTYADLGGVEEVLADIRELIEYPLRHPEVYAWLGVEPPRGVLLHGPPGCGKTALANAIANECGVPFLRVSAPEIVSGMSGESEAKLRQLFNEARELAPCIVFIDEIDAIFPKRETAQREMERRIVAQMLTCMDDLAAPPPPPGEVKEAGKDGTEEDGAGEEGAGSVPRPTPHVVVIGATNRPDSLDTALRRAGRFDREISLGIPTEAARVKILQVLSRRLRLEGNFDFHTVAKRTPGYVGADLAALMKEAAAVAVSRIFTRLEAARVATAAAAAAPAAAAASRAAAEGDAGAAVAAGEAEEAVKAEGVTEPGADKEAAVAAGLPEPQANGPSAGVDAEMAEAAQAAAAALLAADVAAFSGAGFGLGPLGPAELAGLAITMSDFETALPKVQPSVRREGFTTTPDVTWDDVGALAEVREELSFAVTEPIKWPERFEALGLPAASGVLLYGPPGCGKTLVAKAVANESGANFISIKGPELLNKYVGESERAVRQLFARARAAHPCVLFFDELDALAPRRGTDNNQAAERVVNQLLTEMDGVDSRQGLFIVAATNRPDMIDPALLRPGRLEKVLYVPLPPPQDRAAILKALVRKTPLEPDVDLAAVAIDGRCEGYSGADCAALVREAAVLSLKEAMRAGPDCGSPRVGARHFEAALGRVQPSVSRKDRASYEALRVRLRGSRSVIQPAAAAAEAPAAGLAPEAGAKSGGAGAGDPLLHAPSGSEMADATPRIS
ncbi:hypothetical protein HXX76_011823 [Chlamydomonas incerta]|uniref:AAA+ ATPase domain-containing protein n=1 Tax=Chlamydomonas incerta TaxID=51695 RepID=A0A835VW82_CHLIN|nr:hypothetical protein HXX76_011823 [Chlamydomonas incerta]|eukprot:KAG2428143.1 hypothetical protein HXX76_011823 [Chlamydomonas incerta]